MGGVPPRELYDDAYFSQLVAWHRLSQPAFSAFLGARITERFGPRPQLRSLDLGCGSGAYGSVLRPYSARLCGCDGAADALAGADRTDCYDQLFQTDLDRATAGDLDGPYDLVFTTEVIEHLRDPGQLCRLTRDLLAPGGLLVLTTTTYHFYLFYYLAFAPQIRPRELLQWLAGWVDDVAADRFVQTLWELTGGHVSGFRVPRLRRLLAASGLRVCRQGFANVQPLVPDALIAALPAAVRPAGAAGKRVFEACCRRSGFYGANVLLAAERAE